jgi:hypothetical protein
VTEVWPIKRVAGRVADRAKRLWNKGGRVEILSARSDYGMSKFRGVDLIGAIRSIVEGWTCPVVLATTRIAVGD